MKCILAWSVTKSAVYTTPKSNQSTKARIPESISFASHVSSLRISIKIPSGPCRARNPTRIVGFHDVTSGSPYQVLGIDESVSSICDIKKAYKKLARKYHPDVSPPDQIEENARRFIMVKQAYETLTNPHKRALYEAKLHHQVTEEMKEWKMKWQSQLDELKKKSNNISRRESEILSWGARMRTQT